MHYYYAHAYHSEDGFIAPGQLVDGEWVEARWVMPPGCKSLKFDPIKSPDRFVLCMDPAHNNPLPGWESKTASQVEADYPGLISGGS